MNIVAKSSLAALLIGGATTAGLAMADPEDARALAEAGISLTDAIEAAEAHTNGKAFEAAIEDDSFSPEFEVSVVVDNATYDVRVNGETGEVISSRQDDDD